jgi:hypothetical protein
MCVLGGEPEEVKRAYTHNVNTFTFHFASLESKDSKIEKGAPVEGVEDRVFNTRGDPTMHNTNHRRLRMHVVPRKAMSEVVKVALPSCRPTRASLLFHFALLVVCCSSVARASEAQRREELDRTLATATAPNPI